MRTHADRTTRNMMFNKYGFYWSKRDRSDTWELFDRHDHMVQMHEDDLYRDIVNQRDHYEQKRLQAQHDTIHLARGLIAHNCLLLDLETTSTGGETEDVIEIALLSIDGTEQYHSLIHTDIPIHPHATAINGITNALLVQAPTFVDVWQHVSPLLGDRDIVAYHMDFDRRILTTQANAQHVLFPHSFWHCLMRMYMAVTADGSRYRLEDACRRYGIEPSNHRAVADAQAARHLLLRMGE